MTGRNAPLPTGARLQQNRDQSIHAAGCDEGGTAVKVEVESRSARSVSPVSLAQESPARSVLRDRFEQYRRQRRRYPLEAVDAAVGKRSDPGVTAAFENSSSLVVMVRNTPAIAGSRRGRRRSGNADQL